MFVINRYRKLKVVLVLLLALAIVVQPSMVSLFNSNAEEEDGFTVTHEVTTSDGSTTTSSPALKVEMGEVVEAELQFSTSNILTDYYGVELVYQLPAGTTYIDNQDLNSLTVDYKGYDEDDNTVTFELYNTETTTGPSLKVLESGTTGVINIKFSFNDPSPYPDNTNVELSGGYFTWETKDGVSKSLELGSRNLNYQLDKSWIITKGSDTSKTIVSDPTVTYIDVPYSITLSDGDINLKDVMVTDEFPDYASLVDGSVSVSGQTLGSDYTLTTSSTALVVNIEDVAAGKSTTIDLTLRYAIDRDGEGEETGVYDGYIAENRAYVTGYAITTVQSGDDFGEEIRSDFLEAFANNDHDDTASTTFNRSSAVWKLELTPSDTIYIPENYTNNKVTEDYTVTLSGGDIQLKNATIVYDLPEHVIAATATNSGVVDIAAGTITWGPRDISNGSTFTADVTLTYVVDRSNADPTDLGVSDGSERISSVSVTSNQVDASGGVGPEYVFPNGYGTAEVTTDFEDMVLRWNANKWAKDADNSGVSSIALEYVDEDEEIGPYYYYLAMSRGKESNAPYSPDEYDYIPIDDIVMIDTLPDHAKYIEGSYSLHNANSTGTAVLEQSGQDAYGYGGELKFTLKDVSKTTNDEIQYYNTAYVKVGVMFKVDGDGSDVNSSNGATDGTGVGVGEGYIEELTNTVTVSDAFDHLGNPVEIYNDTKEKKITFTRTDEPTDRGIDIRIEDYDENSSYTDSTTYNEKSSSTYPGYKNFDVGDTLNYVVELTNPASTEKDLLKNDTVITIDNLPDAIDYSAIELGQSTDGYGYTVTVDYETETDVVESHQTTSAAIIALVPGQAINSIEIKFTDDISDGFMYDVSDIRLLGTVNSSAASETIYKASATFDYSIMDFGGGTITYDTKSDAVWFLVMLDVAWISNFNKTDISDDSDKQYKTNQSVSYRIDLDMDESYGTDTLQDLTIIDVVPAIFDVSEGEAVWTNKDTWADRSGHDGISAPTFEIVEPTTIDGAAAEGQHIILWTFSDPIPEDADIQIEYELPLYTYADQGSHDNLIYLTASNAYAWSYDVSGVDTEDEQVTDSDDYDNDSNTSEDRLMGKKATAVVLATDSVGSRLWVSGELDYDEVDDDRTYTYSRYEDYGTTTPGGRMNYKLEVINYGNVPLDDVEVINILPHIGDTEILSDGTSRNSLWTPYLIEAIDPDGTDIIEDPIGNTSSCDVEILYSTAEDPYREDASGNANAYGSQEPEWSEEAPDDLTSVRSLYITLDNFENGSLGAGEVATFYITMRAPIGAPNAGNLDDNPEPDEVEAAWNAMAMTGVSVTDDDRTQLLWNMPKKVGVAIQDHENGEIGNYVWFDSNGNGLMDDGYNEAMASGLNGILVELYKDGTSTPYDTTRTGYSYDGVPGYYLFPNLPQDDYYVEFEVDSAYGATTYNVDSNSSDDEDSDVQHVGAGDADGTIRLRSDDIVIRWNDSNTTDQNKIDHSIDAGLVSSTSGAALTIEKAVTHVDPLDGGKRVLASADEAINEGETLYYTITVANPGDIDQHLVKVADDLESDGFRFTDHKFVSATGSSTDYDSFAENSNVTSKTNTEVVFDVLKPGESYVLYGEYLVDSGDVNGTDLINTAGVWSSEMNDRDSQSEAHATSEVSVNVSGMSLEKTVTELKRNGDDFFTSVADDIEVEVGDVLRYSFTVSNEGNTVLNQVVITDSKLYDMTKTIDSIPVGGTGIVTEDYTVTSADETAGQIVNTAYASHDDIRYTVSDTHITYFLPDSMTVTKSVNLIREAGSDTWQAPVLYNNKVVAELGDTIEYMVFFDNLDYMNLTNVKIVSDVQTGSRGSVTLVSSDNSMIIDDDMPKYDNGYGLIQYTVTEDDFNGLSTLPLVNTVVGSADEVGLRSDSTQVELAGLTITKESDKTNYRYPSDIITYTVTVTNIGSIDLADIAVEDPMIDNADGEKLLETSIDLDAGESKTFVVSYETDSDDVNNSNNGTVSNTVTASHSQVDEVSATKEVEYLPSNRQLIITKSTEVEEYRSAGEDIPYEITVTNNGEIDFTGVNKVNIVDELLGLDIYVEILAGATYYVHDHYDLTYTTTADDVGEDKRVDNTASADCAIADKQEATASVPYVANVYKLSVTKDATNTDEYRVAGDVITFDILIRNEGNTDLNNVVITDPLIVNPATGEAPYIATVPRIAEGESYTDTVTYTVTKADEALEKIVNSVTVISAEGAEDSAEATVINRPYNYVMVLDKGVVESEYRETGDVLHYTLDVTNTSDVPLTDVLVEDDMLDLSYTIGEIPVNGTVRVPTDLTVYTVKEDDKDPDGLTNRATATDDYAGESVDFVTVPFRAYDYDYSVSKTVEESDYRDEGDALNYTVTVANTGDGVLTDVAVIDPLINLNASIETLAVDEAVTFNGTYLVDSDDIEALTVENTVTVSDDKAGTKTASVTVLFRPYTYQLSLTKAADKDSFNQRDDDIVYTLTVTNEGDIALDNVNVVDDLLTIDETFASLAIGESKILTGTYVLSSTDYRAGEVINVASASADLADTVYAGTETPYVKISSGSSGSSSETTTEAETTTTVATAESSTTETTTTTTTTTTTASTTGLEETTQSTVVAASASTLVPTTTVNGVAQSASEAIPAATTVPTTTNKYFEQEASDDNGNDDDDDDTITYRTKENVVEVKVLTPPSDGTLTILDGEMVYAPGPTFDGRDQVVLLITNDDGTEEEMTLDIFEDIPQAAGGLPKSGGIPADLWVGVGMLFMGTGLGLKVRRKRR